MLNFLIVYYRMYNRRKNEYILGCPNVMDYDNNIYEWVSFMLGLSYIIIAVLSGLIYIALYLP